MSCFDQAVPGTGPAIAPIPHHSLDYYKYFNYNTSLRSKSDHNLNPIPEGNVAMPGPNKPTIREGYYVVDTDRGDLYPTVETQMNVKGQNQFILGLQDPVRPTTKESTLFTYEGLITPIQKNPSLYSQFIPQYANVGGQTVRVGGSSNYGLKSATDFSYTPGAGTTSLNNNVIQDPNVVIKNLWKRPDFNVDGPGTFKGAIPDAQRFQNYQRIKDPTTSGLKLNLNLETSQGEYSPLLKKNVHSIENRYTSAYQIAPLFNNPLHVIWNPDNKGELPSFYTDGSVEDYSPIQMQRLEKDTFVNGGYNQVWGLDPTKDSTNAYLLGLGQGLHNGLLEWENRPNQRPGVVYGDITIPGRSYNGNRSLADMYGNNQELIDKVYYHNNMYATLGSPNAGYFKNG